MFKLINNFFNYSKNDLFKKNTLDIQKNFPVKKIFDAIKSFSDESDVYYVGGCVRKIFCHELVDDIDLATNINPDEVILSLKKNNISSYETGKNHGTITAIIDDKKFEITSLRKDISTDGRHAKVLFSKDWREDAERRDFTFNSIYSNVYGEVFDPFNGRKDLENGCVTFIGDPSKRIKEDYLRILRYIRFFLNYSKKDHEPKIKKIIKQNLDGLLKISKERLIDELKKIIFSKGFINLKKDDFSKEILELVFPSLNNTSFLTDKNKLLIEDIQLNKNFIVLLSAMMIKDLNSINYILYKFNFSNQDKQRLLYIHDNYQMSLEKSFFDRELKKRIYFGEKESLLDLITLQLLIFHKNEKALNDLIKITKKTDLPKFPYNADFLIKNFDYKPGKKMGKKLKELETLWVDNNFKISKEEIKKIVLN